MRRASTEEATDNTERHDSPTHNTCASGPSVDAMPRAKMSCVELPGKRMGEVGATRSQPKWDRSGLDGDNALAMSITDLLFSHTLNTRAHQRAH